MKKMKYDIEHGGKEMKNEIYREKLEEILAEYPSDHADEKTALLALEDGEFLKELGWSQEEVEEMHYEIKKRMWER